MTRFLLDRDVLGAAENPRGNRNVRAWIKTVPEICLFISAVTVMEARKGFARARSKARSAPEAEAIGTYEAAFDDFLKSYEDRILVIDRSVADCWGEMLGRREANLLDAAVAATAAVHGLIVATRNLRHFRRRDVRLLDPFKANPVIEEPTGRQSASD